MLWTVGFMLSVRPEHVKDDLVGTSYGRFFQDDMAYRVTRLRCLIGDLRNEGIALYNQRDLIDHPRLKKWYGSITKGYIAISSNHVNESVTNMTGRYSGIDLLSDFVFTAAPIFD